MIALSVGSAAVAGYGANEQAKSNRALAEKSAKLRAEELHAKTSAEAGERVKQARAERARLRVAAGEAGVSGVSFEDQLYDSFLQEDFDLGALGRDSQFANRANQSNLESAYANNQGPSALELGLGIAAGGYSGYQSGLQIQDTKNRVKDPTYGTS
jgi:Fe-S cluster assembly iron-binding protein IscA